MAIPLQVLVASSLMLSSPAAPDREALRKLAHVPEVMMSINFAINSAMVRAMVFDSDEAAAEIRKIETINPDVRSAGQTIRLADLYSAVDRDKEASALYGTAIKQLDPSAIAVPERPESAKVLAHYASALLGTRRLTDAETVARHSLKLAPHDSAVHVLLADVLTSQVLDSLLGQGIDTQSGRDFAIARLKDFRSDPNKHAEADRRLREAGELYQRATVEDPRSIHAAMALAWHRALDATAMARLLRAARDPAGSDDPLPLISKAFTEVILDPALIAGLQKVADLGADRPSLTSTYLCLTALIYRKDHPNEDEGPVKLSALPPDQQASVSKGLDRLRALAKKGGDLGDRSTAALVSSLFFLGLLDEAAPLAQQLVKSRPDLDMPHEMLSFQYIQMGQIDKIVDLYSRRVQRHDTVRSRLILARAADKQERWDDAEREIEAALKLEPSNTRAIIGRLALYVRRGDAGSLKKAGALFEETKPRIEKEAVPEDRLEFEVVHGLWYALNGDTKEALAHFRRIREAKPDHEGAAQAIKMLETDASGL